MQIVCGVINYKFYVLRYYAILRRHNYVTPTSYLELILTFKNLLSKKRNEIMLLKQRYVTGLEKLAFAASQVGTKFLYAAYSTALCLLYQVSEMQQQLQDLQPELIQTSEETKKLMVKIEKDTVEAEAKKEV